MGDLANYSIETDRLVWLAFKDGRNFRVPVNHLAKYLSPRDLQRVRRAIKMRHDFLRHHMPGTLLVLLGLGLAVLALAAGGGQVVAHIFHQPTPAAPPPPRTEIVRNVNPENTKASPLPSPLVSPPAERAVAASVRPAPGRSKPAASRIAHPQVIPAVAVKADLGPVSVAVTPIATPPGNQTADPVPSPSPVPTPVPEPTPPAGQVLGDSTGPGGSTDPGPGTTPVIP